MISDSSVWMCTRSRSGRPRLQKFLRRHGRRPPQGLKAWTQKHVEWVRREVHFEAPAQEAVLVDHLAEVEHARERIRRLEGSIDVAVEAAPACLRAVIEALQGLRGIAKVSAAAIVSEVGSLSRFRKPPQLMGYSGGVPREGCTGERVPRGAATKTGNAHPRRTARGAGRACPATAPGPRGLVK